MAGELAARSAARLLSAALLLTCCARGSDAFRAGGTVLGAHQRPESASACPRPRALRARGAPACARGLQGARVPRAGAGARAAGGVRMQSTDPQWYAFQGYNLGTWAGTAMHIDPETGDYAQPYVIRQYSLEVTEVQDKDGRESAVEKLVAEATKTLPALETSKTVAADDDFDATPDGAYSLDRRGVRVPDTSTTANLLVEMSIPMSDDERECPVLLCLPVNADGPAVTVTAPHLSLGTRVSIHTSISAFACANTRWRPRARTKRVARPPQSSRYGTCAALHA